MRGIKRGQIHMSGYDSLSHREEGRLKITVPSPQCGGGLGWGDQDSQQGFPYCLLDCLDVSQHLMIPESQYLEPLRAQPYRPWCIWGSNLSMLPPIELRDHLFLKTYKVNDITTQRLLSPELLSLQLAKEKMLPKCPFGFSGILP